MSEEEYNIKLEELRRKLRKESTGTGTVLTYAFLKWMAEQDLSEDFVNMFSKTLRNYSFTRKQMEAPML